MATIEYTPSMPAGDLVNAKDGLVSREIFVNEDIFRREVANLFKRCWLFVGHESQIPNPGDFFVSRMGTDSVLMTRDDQGEIHVLLNSCRHRGMKVCRYDEGNTLEFYCPYHGWAYSTDGSLVSHPGELYGVPHYETSYAARLDKQQWGLVSCPQVANYKGLIYATWDEKAPPFLEYLGDFHYWLDSLADGLDGTPGKAIAFRGVHKWRVPTNWKFVNENFLGDHYHAIPTHVSVEAAGIGPGGIGHSRAGGDKRNMAAAMATGTSTSFTVLGHGACDSVNQDHPYPWESFPEAQFQDYYRKAWEDKVKRYSAENHPLGARAPGTLFPNMSFHSLWMPRTILVAHPISATVTEMWRWYLIDSDAPDFINDWMRHYAVRYSGPAGLTEQDDMENWGYATQASMGEVAKDYDYNYSMGVGMTRPAEGLRGAVEAQIIPSEENARNYYHRWARLVDGEDWRSLMRDA